MTTLQPLSDRVLVRRDPETTTTPGGLHIPGNAQEKELRGTVVAVGPGKRLENGTLTPMAVGPGDAVLFGKYSGSEVKVGSEDLILLREDDILGRFQ